MTEKQDLLKSLKELKIDLEERLTLNDEIVSVIPIGEPQFIRGLKDYIKDPVKEELYTDSIEIPVGANAYILSRKAVSLPINTCCIGIFYLPIQFYRITHNSP